MVIFLGIVVSEGEVNQKLPKTLLENNCKTIIL